MRKSVALSVEFPTPKYQQNTLPQDADSSHTMPTLSYRIYSRSRRSRNFCNCVAREMAAQDRDCVARGMQAVGLQCVAPGMPAEGRNCVARGKQAVGLRCVARRMTAEGGLK
jgi:hypothetical protein